MLKKMQSSAGMIIFGLAILVLAAWLVWQFFETYISPTWTRVIAIVSMASLPVVGWACYNLGLTEAKGKLKGIDAGIERVTRAATAAIDLRAMGARAMRETTTPPGVVTLPNIPPVIITRQLADGNDVVEL